VTWPGITQGFETVRFPVTILTTEAGARNLRRLAFGPNVVIRTPARADRVQPLDVVAAAAELGGRLILCEGGPHILGQFVKAKMLDELFLTLAPQLAGRTAQLPRLALLEGAAFGTADAPWGQLRSAHASGDHLFLRYGFELTTRAQRQEDQP
jgi:riboflavin biosynthesis pyrimidine reductase